MQLGFAIGPMLLAPLSEYFGRRRVYLISWFIFTVFQLPVSIGTAPEAVRRADPPPLRSGSS